ncbi:MAG: glycosyltransferase family 2 protein [Patescibacteria group bacterium]|nr:glycosyltransferase family 2 protein [Patescibacteria group bacterium]
MPKPFLSVIIPAYNEAQRLPLTLINVDYHLSRVEYSSEIIVVNDGSVDGTREIVERFSGLIKNLRFIDNNENHGKGYAVKIGMLAAHGNFRIFMDADNSTSVDHFNKAFPYLREGFDIIIGSRTHKESKLKPSQPLFKRLLGKAGNLFVRLNGLAGFHDTQCGFKCFSEEAAEKIFKLVKINGWAFDVEILFLAKILGLKIKEIPVVWVNDIQSRVNFIGYLKTLADVVKIRYMISKGKYDLSVLSQKK